MAAAACGECLLVLAHKQSNPRGLACAELMLFIVFELRCAFMAATAQRSALINDNALITITKHVYLERVVLADRSCRSIIRRQWLTLAATSSCSHERSKLWCSQGHPMNAGKPCCVRSQVLLSPGRTRAASMHSAAWRVQSALAPPLLT